MDWDDNLKKMSYHEGDQVIDESGTMYEFKNGDWEYIGQYPSIPGIPALVPGIHSGVPNISLPVDMMPVPAV